MPNRRGRTGAKAKRPSSCSPVSTSGMGRGACGRGFPAVAIFDLLLTEVITPECESGIYRAIFSRTGRTLHLPGVELRSQGRHEAMGGEWIKIGARKFRRSKG